jgi:hypothetical protein
VLRVADRKGGCEFEEHVSLGGLYVFRANSFIDIPRMVALFGAALLGQVCQTGYLRALGYNYFNQY